MCSFADKNDIYFKCMKLSKVVTIFQFYVDEPDTRNFLRANIFYIWICVNVLVKIKKTSDHNDEHPSSIKMNFSLNQSIRHTKMSMKHYQVKKHIDVKNEKCFFSGCVIRAQTLNLQGNILNQNHMNLTCWELIERDSASGLRRRSRSLLSNSLILFLTDSYFIVPIFLCTFFFVE